MYVCNVCMYVCLYVCMYECMYVCYVCMYVFMYAWMYVCVLVCMYACISGISNLTRLRTLLLYQNNLLTLPYELGYLPLTYIVATGMYMCMCVCMYVCMYACISGIEVSLFSDRHSLVSLGSFSIDVGKLTNLLPYTYIHIHTHTHTHT